MATAVLFASDMARRSPSGGRQVHPKGPLRTVDDGIRERVEKALVNKQWEQKDLAAKLDVSPATITNLLKRGEPRQIKYLPQLFAALDIEDELELVQRKWPSLTPEIQAAIAAIVRANDRSK